MGWKPSGALYLMVMLACLSSLFLAAIFVFPSSESFEPHRVHYPHNRADPQHREATVLQMRKWQGLEIPTTGKWDFYGLEVDMDRKAEPLPGQLRADYDIESVDADKAPGEYAYGPSPAFRYPEKLDAFFKTVSTKPRVLFLPRIATPEELEYLMERAAPNLRRSEVALTRHDAGKSAVNEVRTSKSTWVQLSGKLANLEKRMQTLLGQSWHEPMNILKYGPNQHYDSHHDYFDPQMYGAQSSNRMATFFVYLNDTEAGGATTVPRANGQRMPPTYKKESCRQGLQVYPRKGSAIVLYDMRPDRSLDIFSLHGGCDVEVGSKWGGVVWFRTSTRM